MKGKNTDMHRAQIEHRVQIPQNTKEDVVCSVYVFVSVLYVCTSDSCAL